MEAHVVVITVTGRVVTVTCTDIHMQRLQFFQGLFEGRGITWADTLSKTLGGKKKGDIYHLTVGTFTTKNDAELLAFLAYPELGGERLIYDALELGSWPAHGLWPPDVPRRRGRPPAG